MRPDGRNATKPGALSDDAHHQPGTTYHLAVVSTRPRTFFLFSDMPPELCEGCEQRAQRAADLLARVAFA